MKEFIRAKSISLLYAYSVGFVQKNCDCQRTRHDYSLFVENSDPLNSIYKFGFQKLYLEDWVLGL